MFSNSSSATSIEFTIRNGQQKKFRIRINRFETVDLIVPFYKWLKILIQTYQSTKHNILFFSEIQDHINSSTKLVIFQPFFQHYHKFLDVSSFLFQLLTQKISISLSTGYQSPRPPPLATTKSNSLSLPDSPTVAGYQRGRSNSLRVIDDILMRRSNSLRQGLMNVGRRKSSLEDIGLSHFSTNYNNPIKIALNGSIGKFINILYQ